MEDEQKTLAETMTSLYDECHRLQQSDNPFFAMIGKNYEDMTDKAIEEFTESADEQLEFKRLEDLYEEQLEFKRRLEDLHKELKEKQKMG